MGKMQRTNLVWDDYIDYLIDAINGSKFMKRAEDKPMSTPKTAEESHVTTRAIHLRESADIAKRLAKGLGLNEGYIQAAMLVHDAGHPFSAHEGEEIFNQLGEVYDTQYFHHNAKGIEIILSEDLCGKAISKIPNITNKPELRKQLEEEFWYFLDAVISHDGEATKEDMMKPETKYDGIKQAVQAKMRSANSENKYKFIAQTPEGKIAKFADVIAYLSSDMQDGFRLGILKDFSDDYLALFGEMFSQEYPLTQEDKIECGRRIIEQIKEQNLREKKETIDFMSRQDEDMQNALKNIHRNMQLSGLNIHDKSDILAIQDIFEREQEAYRRKKLEEFYRTIGADIPEEKRQSMEEQIAKKTAEGIPLDDMEKKLARTLQQINSSANKIEEFGTKMLRARSSTVYEVTSKMKEYFINDLIRNSQNQDTPQFSNAAWDLFFKAKKLNYREFVQYTNWDYQTEELPQAAMELARECATGLQKSGAIRNKFYDEAVRSYITDPEALEYMETAYRPEEEYTSFRKEHGIGDLKAYTRTSNSRFTGNKQQDATMRLLHNLYSYVQNENEVFAIRYENTFNAIKTRVSRKIEKALSEEHSVSDTHLYKDILQEQIDTIRQEAIDSYGTTQLTPEQKEEFIKGKIKAELDSMEHKMAIQLSTDYLAGMTDKSFVDTAIKTGHLDPNVVQNAARGTLLSTQVQQLMTNIEEEQRQEQAELPTSPAGDER